MNINALNSANDTYFQSFISNFCTPSCLFHWQSQSHIFPNKIIEVHLQLDSLPSIVLAYSRLSGIYPDLTFVVKNIQIQRQLTSSACKITASIHGHGRDLRNNSQNLEEYYRCSTTINNYHQHNDIEHQFNNALYGSTLYERESVILDEQKLIDPPPFPLPTNSMIYFIGQITLSIDDQMKITGIDISFL